MNIKARINARKIVLIYFYEQYFFETSGEKKTLLEDVERVQKILHDSEDDVADLDKVFTKDYYDDVDGEIAYIISHHFRKFESGDIDFDYIDAVAPKFYDFRDLVREKVDSYTISFGYDEMDLIDRVIFVLGYIEYLTMDTPKEIVLNEMVELAKRYGDDSSSKLINGIGHKILSSLDDEKKNN